MAGKRKGLGKGLGAYFGDDLMMESTIKKSEHSVASEKVRRKRNAASDADDVNDTKNKDKEKKNIEKNTIENQDIENKDIEKTEEKVKNPRGLENSEKSEKLEKSEESENTEKSDAGKAAEKQEKESRKNTENHVYVSDSMSEQMMNENTNGVDIEAAGDRMMKLSLIVPNSGQPRKKFDKEQLNELAESIKKYGVLQPLLVQKKDQYYEIIAGERRWRAAAMAGLQEVPVMIRDYDKQKSMEVALIENLQREDLNPVEEALAYQQLMEEFHLTQEEIAEKVSKSRTAITNTVRLLKLDSRVLDILVEGGISSGHARALLTLEDGDLQLEAARKIMVEGLSVRNVERLVKKLAKPEEEKKKEPERDDSFIYRSLEDRMKTIMGTKVSINRKDKNKGRIEIEYYSSDELERIVELIESIQEEKTEGGKI